MHEKINELLDKVQSLAVEEPDKARQYLTIAINHIILEFNKIKKAR